MGAAALTQLLHDVVLGHLARFLDLELDVRVADDLLQFGAVPARLGALHRRRRPRQVRHEHELGAATLD